MNRLFLLLICLFCFDAHSQIAVRLLHFRPTGDQGVVFKKRFTAEVMYMTEFEDRLRSRVGGSFAPLKSRLDTFPSYAVKTDGNGTQVSPGYEIYRRYMIGFVFAGSDWAFIDKDKIQVYIGADVLAGVIAQDYENRYVTNSEYSFKGVYAMGGLRFRAGTQYVVNDQIIVFAELTRSYYGIQETGFQSHYDYGAGVQYLF